VPDLRSFLQERWFSEHHGVQGAKFSTGPKESFRYIADLLPTQDSPCLMLQLLNADLPGVRNQHTSMLQYVNRYWSKQCIWAGSSPDLSPAGREVRRTSGACLSVLHFELHSKVMLGRHPDPCIWRRCGGAERQEGMSGSLALAWDVWRLRSKRS